MISMYFDKNTYENSKKIVEYYEARKERLNKLGLELQDHLIRDFKSFNWKFSHVGRKTTFIWENRTTGIVEKTITRCEDADCYNKMIGELIAVRKALKLDISDINDIIEMEDKNPLLKQQG